MKKQILLSSFVFCVISSIITTTAAFADENLAADLYKPNRYFEIGVDSEAGGANNYFSTSNLLVKDLVIDFNQISNDISDDGLQFGVATHEKAFVNLNIGEKCRLSFFGGVDATGFMSISHDLFAFLAEGIEIGETRKVDVTGHFETFVHAGVSLQTKIKGFAVKFMPSYFVPLVYVPETTATGSLSTKETGEIKAYASAPVEVYSCVSLQSMLDDNKIPEIAVNEILSNGGFDFGLALEKRFFPSLDAGLFTRIPIVAGTLKHKASTSYYASFETNGLLGKLSDSEEHNSEHGHTDWEYSEEDFKIHRPLKVGLNASCRPFGGAKWFRINPMAAIAVRNPYTSDSKIYAEYSLDALISAFNIFNLTFGTSYLDEMFYQKLGFGFNFRVIEIICQARLAGTDFATSFSGTGASAYAGVRIGF